ncbi:MAG: DUF4159 domain-containing protein, partial [Candidatus Brocadiia bacterium]
NGMWGYSVSGRDFRGISETGDNSNTQFALLGLKAAQDAGIQIPVSIWKSSRDHFRRTQVSDGGWGYSAWTDQERIGSYCSMTAAGVASLWLAQEAIDGKKHHCADRIVDIAFENGVKWLDSKFDPNSSIGGWDSYMLYSVERAGILTAKRYFGGFDWYRGGASVIVSRLVPGDPSEVAFSLLFLAKGRTPLMVQKLERRGNDWDNDHYDLENLTQYISKELGKPVTWQLARMRVNAEDLLEAPVLFISGLKDIDLSPPERSILREYIYNGGTVLAVACSDSDQFDRSFRKLMSEMFPDSPLMPLPKDHEIYDFEFDIPPDNRPTIFGLSDGCSTNVLYIPKGSYSCKWTTADPAGSSFELGTNILRFLVGDRRLKNRVDPVEFSSLATMSDRPDRPQRGAVVVGQIRHGGQWKPHRLDVPHLMAKIRDEAGVTVGVAPEPVELSTTDLYTYPILFETGHFGFDFDKKACERLAEFLQRGGTLFAEACCGRVEFDASFRKFIAGVLPDKPLQKIPLTASLMTCGYDIRQVAYRPMVAKLYPDLVSPDLEGIQIGSRYCVIYSKYSIACGLDSHPCPLCRGYAPDDCFKIAVNIFLYALKN